MNVFFAKIWIAFLFFTSVTASRRAFIMDEHWVCSVKKSCFNCLKLPFCSWCETENKCFSHKLASSNYCENSTIDFTEYGFSIQENAKCSCASGKTEKSCYPSKITEGPECSGRGICVCGHCVCNLKPDPDNPTKVIIGKYCELDNFSCEGPNCKEGPYSIIKDNEKDDSFTTVTQE